MSVEGVVSGFDSKMHIIFGHQTAHRATNFGHHTYLERCMAEGSQPCHVFRCPGTTLMHVAIDSMHAADLGTFPDAVGSLFWTEITCKRFHASARAGLAWLNDDLTRFYSANRRLV